MIQENKIKLSERQLEFMGSVIFYFDFVEISKVDAGILLQDDKQTLIRNKGPCPKKKVAKQIAQGEESEDLRDEDYSLEDEVKLVARNKKGQTVENEVKLSNSNILSKRKRKPIHYMKEKKINSCFLEATIQAKSIKQFIKQASLELKVEYSNYHLLKEDYMNFKKIKQICVPRPQINVYHKTENPLKAARHKLSILFREKELTENSKQDIFKLIRQNNEESAIIRSNIQGSIRLDFNLLGMKTMKVIRRYLLKASESNISQSKMSASGMLENEIHEQVDFDYLRKDYSKNIFLNENYLDADADDD